MKEQADGKWFPSQRKQGSFSLSDTLKTLFADALSIADGCWWPWMIEAWLIADSRANEISNFHSWYCVVKKSFLLMFWLLPFSNHLLYSIKQIIFMYIDMYYLDWSKGYFSHNAYCQYHNRNQAWWRTYISHPVHSDNCVLDTDREGTCPKRAPAYTWRDYR